MQASVSIKRFSFGQLFAAARGESERHMLREISNTCILMCYLTMHRLLRLAPGRIAREIDRLAFGAVGDPLADYVNNGLVEGLDDWHHLANDVGIIFELLDQVAVVRIERDHARGACLVQG